MRGGGRTPAAGDRTCRGARPGAGRRGVLRARYHPAAHRTHEGSERAVQPVLHREQLRGRDRGARAGTHPARAHAHSHGRIRGAATRLRGAARATERLQGADRSAGLSVRAFRYAPARDRVTDLQQRLARARILPAAADPAARLGIPPAELARLAEALAVLDWEAFAERVNAHPAFLALRGAEQLHFVHARSNANDAVPLLLLHGWPGSFLEFQGVVCELTRAAPAFHVVCPSLPG